MRREKTGTEVLGSRLFGGSRMLDRWLYQLPAAVADQLKTIQKTRPHATPEQLRAALHSEFNIRPLEIHDLASIRIELQPRDYLNEYRCWMRGYLAEAVVPYSGGGVLWKTELRVPFTFGFPGQIGPSAARLRTFLDGKDFDWFEEKVEVELRSARAMLEQVATGMTAVEESVQRVVDREADKLLAAI